MSRIHNIMLIRGTSIVIAFSVIFHVLALTDQLNLLEYISVIGVPLVFIVMINFSHRKPTLWLLTPFTLYLIDRFFIYMWRGIDGLSEGLAPRYQNDTLLYFFQLNSVRLIVSLILVILIISTITSAQKQWFYKLHKLTVVLLILQAIEIGLWLGTGLYRLSPSVIEQLIIVPGLLYFPLLMIFITRLHIYEVFVEQGVHGESSTPQNIGLHQPKKPPVNPQENVSIPPKKAESSIPNRPPKTAPKPTPKPTSNPGNKTPINPPPKPKNVVCPLCGTSNTNTQICRNCGQSLK